MTFAALAVIFGCAAAGFSQIKVGGYKPIAKEDATAKLAAEYAVTAQNKVEDAEMSLESVESAERQIVAGTNYKLCLAVNVPGADETITEFYQTVVFYSLKREFTLKSWTQIEDCDK